MFVIFGTHILLDKWLKALQFPLHLIKLAIKGYQQSSFEFKSIRVAVVKYDLLFRDIQLAWSEYPNDPLNLIRQ